MRSTPEELADRLTEEMGPWNSPDNRAVFRSAVLEAFRHGLAYGVAQAVFHNAADAVRHEERAA